MLETPGRDNRREDLTRLAGGVAMLLVLALVPGLELVALPGGALLSGLAALLVVASPTAEGTRVSLL